MSLRVLSYFLNFLSFTFVRPSMEFCGMVSSSIRAEFGEMITMSKTVLLGKQLFNSQYTVLSLHHSIIFLSFCLLFNAQVTETTTGTCSGSPLNALLSLVYLSTPICEIFVLKYFVVWGQPRKYGTNFETRTLVALCTHVSIHIPYTSCSWSFLKANVFTDWLTDCVNRRECE